MSKINFYVQQTKGFNLGNFVMCTPTISTLHKYFKERIPIIFTVDYLAEMYNEWNAIEIITEKQANIRSLARLFGTELTNQKIPDIIFIHRIVCNYLRIKQKVIPWTYAPKLTPTDTTDYAVIIRGCVPSGVWKNHKFIPEEYYKNAFDKIDMKLKFVGSTNDYNEYLKSLVSYAEKGHEIDLILDNPKQILREINGAKFVLTNDTGWYHIAGALDKLMFCMWKDTPFRKNLVPSKKCFYSHKGHWDTDFEEWYGKYVMKKEYEFDVNIICPQDPTATPKRIEQYKEYYKVKYSICKKCNPKIIAEIGVRAGYSGWTFLQAVPKAKYIGIDANNGTHGGQGGEDGKFSKWAQNILRKYNTKFIFLDTQTIERLQLGEKIDFFHVDGDHTMKGVQHDLDLAFDALAENGYILVDDIGYIKDVKMGVEKWLEKHKSSVSFEYIPSFRGECLIHKKI